MTANDPKCAAGGQPAPDPALTFIIITWNSRHVIGKCLETLRATRGGCPGVVVVVDNASTDGTAEAVARACPQAQVVRHQRNLGFAAAANRGLAAVRTPFAVILNPDTFVSPDIAVELARRMTHMREVGIATCRLLTPAGSEHPSYGLRYPGERRAIATGATGGPGVLEVAYVYGALMVVQMDAARQVGPFDERFFMYYEDADWCCRMRRAGWRVVLFADRCATHLGGESSTGVSGPSVAERYFRSELLFRGKHYPGASHWYLLAKRTVATIIRLGTYSCLCAVSNHQGLWRKWIKYRARAAVLMEYLCQRPTADER